MDTAEVEPLQPAVCRSVELEWIPRNKSFSFDDLVFWQGKANGVPFSEVAGNIDTIVAGPHASAAYPEELRPFISPLLTRRKQFDYSDVSTKEIGRAWATCDPHVVFIENPHARWIFDPNRERPRHDDTAWSPQQKLRQFYRRRRFVRNICSKVCCVSQTNMMRFAFAGADTVRPVTFAGEDVLTEPQDASEWAALVGALQRAADLGPRRYDEALYSVVDRVLAARGHGPLSFISLHDTSNCQVRPVDGAVIKPRPESGRYPRVVNFGNAGNAYGDGNCCMAQSCCGVPKLGCDPKMMALRCFGIGLTTPGPRMRSIASAWAMAFGEEVNDPETWVAELGHVPASDVYKKAFSFNRPSLGVRETFNWAEEFHVTRAMPNVDVFQVEFERAQLIGSQATGALKEGGESWPPEDVAHVQSVAQAVQSVANNLKTAGDILRRLQ